jgi:hypothetical protein
VLRPATEGSLGGGADWYTVHRGQGRASHCKPPQPTANGGPYSANGVGSFVQDYYGTWRNATSESCRAQSTAQRGQRRDAWESTRVLIPRKHSSGVSRLGRCLSLLKGILIAEKEHKGDANLPHSLYTNCYWLSYASKHSYSRPKIRLYGVFKSFISNSIYCSVTDLILLFSGRQLQYKHSRPPTEHTLTRGLYSIQFCTLSTPRPHWLRSAAVHKLLQHSSPAVTK